MSLYTPVALTVLPDGNVYVWPAQMVALVFTVFAAGNTVKFVIVIKLSQPVEV